MLYCNINLCLYENKRNKLNLLAFLKTQTKKCLPQQGDRHFQYTENTVIIFDFNPHSAKSIPATTAHKTYIAHPRRRQS